MNACTKFHSDIDIKIFQSGPELWADHHRHPYVENVEKGYLLRYFPVIYSENL